MENDLVDVLDYIPVEEFDVAVADHDDVPTTMTTTTTTTTIMMIMMIPCYQPI